VDRYKACLLAQGFTQIYGVDYLWTFSLMARLSFIRVLFSLAFSHQWLMFQLNVKNAFLYSHLEEMYTEQPLGYVTQ